MRTEDPLVVNTAFDEGKHLQVIAVVIFGAGSSRLFAFAFWSSNRYLFMILCISGTGSFSARAGAMFPSFLLSFFFGDF